MKAPEMHQQTRRSKFREQKRIEYIEDSEEVEESKGTSQKSNIPVKKRKLDSFVKHAIPEDILQPAEKMRSTSSSPQKMPTRPVGVAVKPSPKKSVPVSPPLVSTPKQEKPVSTSATPTNTAAKTLQAKTPQTPHPNRAASYIAYINRGGPKAPGSKPIPEGAENCLEGLTFVITGVLDSLERDEAADLIKKYGGKVTQSVSKRTSYLVVGEGAGESKLSKAASFGTKQIDEDGLLELIRTLPTKTPGGRAKAQGKKSDQSERTSPASMSPLKPKKMRVTEPLTPVGKGQGPTVVTPTSGHVTSSSTPTSSHLTTPSITPILGRKNGLEIVWWATN